MFLLLLIAMFGSVGFVYFYTEKKDNERLQEEEKRNYGLLKDDYYYKRRSTFDEWKKDEIEFEKNVRENSKENDTYDPFEVNFYSDKKEVLDIQNLGSSDDYFDVLITNIVMFLNYHKVSITKEEITEYFKITSLKEVDGKIVGESPEDSCIANLENQVIGCMKPYVDKVVQTIFDEKKPGEYLDSRDNEFGLNIHYSIPDIPVIIWVGKDYQEKDEITSWYSYDGTKKYTMPKNMHIVLFMGYDKENFYINDPLKEGTFKIKREVLEKTYDFYGRQKVFRYYGRAGLYK